MIRTFTDRDADPAFLTGKTVAIIGYGSQGRAHALNLHDSGVNVVVGLRDGSSSAQHARNDGLPVRTIAQAVSVADVTMVLVPDEEQPAVYASCIAPFLAEGAYLGFAHGFAIHYGTIAPPQNVNVFMVAPKAPGPMVRQEYAAGRGVPCLVCVHQDPSGQTQGIALAYARAIGGGRAGILATTFKEETESDLFGEQAVLCGGLSALVRAGFETLVEGGYAPEMAYFECLHEVKLIVDLMYARGIEGMREGISNTARFGDYTRGNRVVGDEAKAAMKIILQEVQSGSFAREWMAEHAAGKPAFQTFSEQARGHAIERVGKELRSLMPWMNAEEKPAVSAINWHDDELKFRVC